MVGPRRFVRELIGGRLHGNSNGTSTADRCVLLRNFEWVVDPTSCCEDSHASRNDRE